MSNEKSEVQVKDLRAVLKKFNEDLGQYINAEERYKLGRILTVVDASISDPEQRKAIKDLINSQWWDRSYRATETEMGNPHSDLRGICLALGFDLYPNIEGQYDLPGSDNDAEYCKQRYENVLKTSR